MDVLSNRGYEQPSENNGKGNEAPPEKKNFELEEQSRGGGGYFAKFYTGRLRPEVQPLTLSYTILAEKVPLSYTRY